MKVVFVGVFMILWVFAAISIYNEIISENIRIVEGIYPPDENGNHIVRIERPDVFVPASVTNVLGLVSAFPVSVFVLPFMNIEYEKHETMSLEMAWKHSPYERNKIATAGMAVLGGWVAAIWSTASYFCLFVGAKKLLNKVLLSKTEKRQNQIINYIGFALLAIMMAVIIIVMIAAG